jgi:hypothetical protein
MSDVKKATKEILTIEEFKAEIEKLVCAPQILPNLETWYKAYKKENNTATNEKK